MLVCAKCGEENPDRARFCLACGTPLAAAGEPERFSRTVTMLCSDVVGSTALGERLDPEPLAHVVGAYLETMRPVVEAHGGEVEKFIGDALVAVFGFDGDLEDGALAACRAALAMRERLAALNAELERERGVTLQTRTGITTGEVAGSGQAAARSLVGGDTHNTASSLESAADAGQILLGEPTYRLVAERVRADAAGTAPVKGKGASIPAFRLDGLVSA